MFEFAANLSMLFTEVPFPARFESAAESGFRAVEYLFPYEWPADQLREQLERHQLRQALFNAPPGDWQAGERGLACLAGREEDFGAGLEAVLDYASVLENHLVHVMAGIVPAGQDPALARDTYIRNIQQAADILGQAGLTVCIEPINHADMPGYFLNTVPQALGLLDEISRENVRLQFDIYHCQRTTGDVTLWLERALPQIGHIQIAGVPGRHEPDYGELNYPWLFERLRQLGYSGYVGCEYVPAGKTEDGLAWLKEELSRK
ncbi:MAG: hydroxypyruvate isomerase [Gammaproteobacteria bacterium]|nr:MAG: hydroxypyruvate isomerase [Gammaproteobacteria bacterium]